MRPVLLRLFCVVLALSGTGCFNILETFADKTTNEELYEEALKLINEGDFDGALVKIALMTGEFPARREVVSLKASAHAGNCGLNFFNIVDALKDMGTTRLFPLLLAHFAGGTASRIDSCIQAEDLIESIGDINARTSNENMFLVLISFAKIGSILSLYADSDQDGVVTPGYDSCAVGTPGVRAAGDLTDQDARQLGTGLALAMINITAVASSVDLGNASLAALTEACDDLPPSYDFCGMTDPDDFDPSDTLKGVRTFVRENAVVGLGSCAGDATACACL